MRRTLLVIGTLLTLLVLAAGVTVNLMSSGTPAWPAPDPLMPITLGDGTVMPLAEVLARSRRAEPLPVPEPLGAATQPGADGDPPAPEALSASELEDLERLKSGVPVDIGVNPRVWHAHIGTVFALAEEHRHKGNIEQAAALYLSIEKGEPGYAYAQRRLAWDISTQVRGQPERGVAHAHAALFDEPLNGNSWQDAARVYAATLGFDLD